MSVYFVQAGDGGRIKIGYSPNAKWRIAALRRMSGPDLQILAVIEGPRTFEGKLHKFVAASRAHDEWFDPTPEVLALVDRAKRMPQAFGSDECREKYLWRIDFTDAELAALAEGDGVVAEVAAQYLDCRSRAYGDALAGLLLLLADDDDRAAFFAEAEKLAA